jgi:hypothetical protein
MFSGQIWVRVTVYKVAIIRAKCPLLSSDFDLNCVLPADFNEIFRTQNSTKLPPPNHHRRTDGHMAKLMHAFVNFSLRNTQNFNMRTQCSSGTWRRDCSVINTILHYVRCVPDTALCVACPWYCTTCGVSLILHYVRCVPDTALCVVRPWYCTMCGESLILHYVRCVPDSAVSGTLLSLCSIRYSDLIVQYQGHTALSAVSGTRRT